MTNRIEHFKLGKQPAARPAVKIVGAAEASDSPQILDRTTRQDPIPAEVRVHEELVTEDQKIRKNKRQPGDPEVRLRQSDRKRWEQVKRLEDE